MINLGNTRLLGHRGARNEALENTLFGFQHAHSLQSHGLAGVEFDVQLTADGYLVVFHDETLQRLCGLQSRIDQLNLVEIQRHLQSGHQIITLDMLAQASSHASSTPYSTLQKLALNRLFGLPDTTAISKTATTPPPLIDHTKASNAKAEHITTIAHALAQFTHIELEIKTNSRTNYPQLIRALSYYLIDTPLTQLPIVLTSFDTQLLAHLQRNQSLAPIPRGLLIRASQLLSAAPNTALQLGCSHLGIHYPLLSQTMIKYCHRCGLIVSAWTVNDIEQIKLLVHWQVDFIITDIPTQLLY